MDHRKVMSPWTTYVLTDHNRAARVTILSPPQLPHIQEFFMLIITGNESWVDYENNTCPSYWLPCGKDSPGQPKPKFHAQKITVSIPEIGESCCFTKCSTTSRQSMPTSTGNNSGSWLQQREGVRNHLVSPFFTILLDSTHCKVDSSLLGESLL
ncbi:hypothetical protein KIN20_030211 [Parelaphostrongylus tenuis]|uniref:Uncharacterized protein n=1 Tax=Parelaphostrongylus tenuis TaxID=148309 RepID=A0AAD5R3G0_PARTN|nr:hypothetical protein KIN20_030211 [Parelaphostrongylus tenuis]